MTIAIVLFVCQVADCVCLMSLDKMEAIPVDTHVKQIAERDYSLHFATKSCTDAVYNKIGKHLQLSVAAI